ncbi:OmpA family protein [Pinisolibacter aquiterrae]|uniref:OmpA family protein n=1 Tax=Pinisolibacter aquiterrae TaxID=2815579 RepID=UPI001EE5CD54|nr:OmpA family protein [Pinisolibacter aquiterrae]
MRTLRELLTVGTILPALVVSGTGPSGSAFAAEGGARSGDLLLAQAAPQDELFRRPKPGAPAAPHAPAPPRPEKVRPMPTHPAAPPAAVGRPAAPAAVPRSERPAVPRPEKHIAPVAPQPGGGAPVMRERPPQPARPAIAPQPARPAIVPQPARPAIVPQPGGGAHAPAIAKPPRPETPRTAPTQAPVPGPKVQRPVQPGLFGNGTPGAAMPPAGVRPPQGEAPTMGTSPGGATPPAMPPQGIGQPVVPPGAVRPMPPQGAGQPMPPQGAGQPMPPQGAGQPMPPQGAGQPMPPQGAGQPMPPQGAGQPMPPQGAGRPMPPQGAGQPMPPMGAGHPMPPRGDGRPMPPQGEVRPHGGGIGAAVGAAAVGAAVGVVGGMILGGEARGLDDVHRQRRETVRDGSTFYSEPGRVIIRDDRGLHLRHDESERFRGLDGEMTTERRGGEIYQVWRRPDGVRIVTVTDEDGRLLRRIRRWPDGRDEILIDNARRPRPARWSDEIVILPPPPPTHRRVYIETERADETEIYDLLAAEPLAPLPRRYSLDEIRVSRDLRAYMPAVDVDTITFASGSWEVEPGQVARLAAVAKSIQRILANSPDEIFLVEGHTDAVGSDIDNLSLSDRRATAVAAILTRDFGVPPENLTTQGYGEQVLKEATSGPSRINRRVTVRRITPLLETSGGR